VSLELFDYFVCRQDRQFNLARLHAHIRIKKLHRPKSHLTASAERCRSRRLMAAVDR
jgi:hypothetical protein